MVADPPMTSRINRKKGQDPLARSGMVQHESLETHPENPWVMRRGEPAMVQALPRYEAHQIVGGEKGFIASLVVGCKKVPILGIRLISAQSTHIDVARIARDDDLARARHHVERGRGIERLERVVENDPVIAGTDDPRIERSQVLRCLNIETGAVADNDLAVEQLADAELVENFAGEPDG